MSNPTEKVACARAKMFSTAHLYKQNQFTDDENRRVFGACYSTYGHGHNYLLELTLEGPLDPRTMQLLSPDEFESLLSTLTSILDHRHLNFDLQEFRAVVPTTENIALYLRAKALDELEKRRGVLGPGVRLKSLRLFETADLWVEVEG